MRIVVPCTKCDVRHPTCHDFCQKFKEYRDELAEQKKILDDIKNEECTFKPTLLSSTKGDKK